MRRRTAACKRRTRIVLACPAPPGFMEGSEDVTCRICCVVSYILRLATLGEKPPVRASTSVTRAAPIPPNKL